MATNTRRAATEDDLRNTPDDGIYELVDGEIRSSPGGVRHGKTSMALVVLLGSYIKEHRLGHVVGPDHRPSTAERERPLPGRQLYRFRGVPE